MIQQYKFLIIEDEDLAARKLKKMLQECEPDMLHLHTCDSIESSVEWLGIANPYPDLIFMDIELADGQSFEIFTRTEIHCPVIFTTAYDEFALKAFKVNSVDYLLKPVKKEELTSALEKWKQVYSNNAPLEPNKQIEKLLSGLMQQQSGEKFRNRFLVKQGHKLIPVAAEEIAYFHTEDKVVFIKTRKSERFIVDFTLDELEGHLDPLLFFRANRQFIVSTGSVKEIHSWFNGKLKVTVHPKPDEEVIISREKASEFKTWMGD